MVVHSNDKSTHIRFLDTVHTNQRLIGTFDQEGEHITPKLEYSCIVDYGDIDVNSYVRIRAI